MQNYENFSKRLLGASIFGTSCHSEIFGDAYRSRRSVVQVPRPAHHLPLQHLALLRVHGEGQVLPQEEASLQHCG